VEKHKSFLLYPPEARELLIMQTWGLEEKNGQAITGREEIYQRVNRFVEHCRKLGIPNPYSWPDIYKADERWKRLHANAVPPLVDFRDRQGYIDECKHVKKLIAAQSTALDIGDFDF
jgi:hypothetical protein